jgi:hypothetical protein
MSRAPLAERGAHGKAQAAQLANALRRCGVSRNHSTSTKLAAAGAASEMSARTGAIAGALAAVSTAPASATRISASPASRRRALRRLARKRSASATAPPTRAAKSRSADRAGGSVDASPAIILNI